MFKPFTLESFANNLIGVAATITVFDIFKAPINLSTVIVGWVLAVIFLGISTYHNQKKK